MGSFSGDLSRIHLWCFALITGFLLLLSLPSQAQPVDFAVHSAEREARFDELVAVAEQKGDAQVLITLNIATRPEGQLLGAESVRGQRLAIGRAQDALLSKVAQFDPTGLKKFKYVPVLAIRLNAAALNVLRFEAGVANIVEDVPLPAALVESVPLVGANAAAAAGHTGSGWAVAVLDTGVDKTHPFLSGKVVSEACYSTMNPAQNSTTLCPNGGPEQVGAGAGVSCPSNVSGCEHGTHVAGIVAGRSNSFTGVAKDAGIIAMQVFSKITGAACTNSGRPSPCTTAFITDLASALQQVYELGTTHNIAAVNMSLGGGQNAGYCDGDPLKPFIDTLKSVKIATVIASGNSSYPAAIAAPACISSAVSVGATTKQDTVPSFSNSASILSLLAPGEQIYSSIPGGVFNYFNGTSMAAPHVAGAWAILKQSRPTATVDEILNALKSTGLPVVDTRNGIAKPRIQVDAARASLISGSGGGTVPTITGFNPTSGPVGTTVTVTGTNFVNVSGVTIGNAPVVSGQLLSSTQLTAVVPSGATSGPIRVTTTAGTATSAGNFNVTTGGGGGGTQSGAFFVTLATSASSGTVRAYDSGTGAPISSFAPPAFAIPTGLARRPTGNLFAGSQSTASIPSVQQFDITTGTSLGTFATSPSGVSDLEFGPNGNLYLIGTGSNTIQQYAGTTGASLGTFAGGLTLVPMGMAFGPDGNLYVTSLGNSSVVQIDGTTGQILRTLAVVSAPGDLTFGPDGKIYVISGNTVKRIEPNLTVVTIVSSGLSTPLSLAFGPDNNLYVTNSGNNTVSKFNGTTGSLIATIPVAGTPRYITFGPAPGGGGGTAPTITSFSPTSGAVGTTVTIIGTNFVPGISVTIGNTQVTSGQVLSSTQLTVIVPSGATSGPIRVTTTAGTATSSTNFNVTTGGGGGTAPTITSFSPTSGAVGTTVTIIGTNFVPGISVTIGNTQVTSGQVLSSTQLTVIVPSGATSGPIRVTTTAGTATSSTNFNVTTGGGGGGGSQLLGNEGFENGSANPAPWVATAGVIDNNPSVPPRSGLWKAFLNGYGEVYRDTLYQTVTIPADATSASLSFYQRIATEETGSTPNDTLKVQIRNSSDAVLATLATYSNLDATPSYVQKTFDLTAYRGQTVRIYFLGEENASLVTIFLIDDTALNIQTGSTPPPSQGLLYYPVTPCRVADTRELPGGSSKLVPETTYPFIVTGTANFSQQGGNAGGCGVPNDAKSVFFNLLSVEPTALGNLRAWAVGTPQPNASVLNYALPNLNIANGIAVPICNSASASCAGNLNVLANGGATHLVIDVVGYFK